MISVEVPQYYLQTDSRTIHADRMCFSSTIAMAIKFLKPNALLGVNADDDYLRTVLKFGDTKYAQAQLKAIETYGLGGKFSTNGTLGDLQRILREGRPVPVGFLHHGKSWAPYGGHWALLTALTDTTARFHDPYGELDNVNGGYPRPGIGGKNVLYTLQNWLPRWTYKGEAWLLDVNYLDAPSVPEYKSNWASVKAIGTHYGAKFPQVVAAQWALESGYGKYQSGKNNFFGIKGTPGTTKSTQEYLNGKWVTIYDTFKDYPSPQACINDLVTMWYKDYKGFKGVNRASSWEQCCQLLRQEGYATDPAYVTKLQNLVKQNEG